MPGEGKLLKRMRIMSETIHTFYSHDYPERLYILGSKLAGNNHPVNCTSICTTSCPLICGLQRMLNTCVSICVSIQLKFDPDKSSCIVFGKKVKYSITPMLLDYTYIPWVDSVRYLGV